MVARLAQTSPCQWHLHSLWDGRTIYCSSSSCCRCRLLDLRCARSICNSGTSQTITVIFVVWFQQKVGEWVIASIRWTTTMLQSWLDSWKVLLTPTNYRTSLTFQLVFYCISASSLVDLYSPVHNIYNCIVMMIRSNRFNQVATE